MGMRTAIDVQYSGVFLVGIEVGGLHDAPVQVGLAIGSLYGSLLEDRLVPLFPRVGGCLQQGAFARLGVGYGTGTGHIGLLPSVKQPEAVLGQLSLVYALAVVQQGALLGLYIQIVDIAL